MLTPIMIMSSQRLAILISIFSPIQKDSLTLHSINNIFHFSCFNSNDITIAVITMVFYPGISNQTPSLPSVLKQSDNGLSFYLSINCQNKNLSAPDKKIVAMWFAYPYVCIFRAIVITVSGHHTKNGWSDRALQRFQEQFTPFFRGI